MKGQNVGYIRVSTVLQNSERQLAGIDLDVVFEEQTTAKTIDRPELDRCKAHCRAGDTLHIHSLDRVCRSGVDDAVKLVNEMLGKGVTVAFHKDGLTFGGDKMSAAQEGVLSILAAVAKMERGLIEERRLEGIEIAKRKGRNAGRKAVSLDVKNKLADMMRDGKKAGEIAKALGLGKSTVYRLMKNANSETETP
ncbi:recombinase family protein [Vibrio sp. OCN044]|uniref:Recombinase family protein n=1 Tax=Vibrio tetraodonis subsp. pristinus TaxID=2695891 RepID=A0A6L8LZT3_9VIBR|nr:recombinase family protein [Vibrio tetraodonis]MYM61618.1 recombinase family protein [Vibrio tetraodonis subsp. pristinus]